MYFNWWWWLLHTGNESDAGCSNIRKNQKWHIRIKWKSFAVFNDSLQNIDTHEHRLTSYCEVTLQVCAVKQLKQSIRIHFSAYITYASHLIRFIAIPFYHLQLNTFQATLSNRRRVPRSRFLMHAIMMCNRNNMIPFSFKNKRHLRLLQKFVALKQTCSCSN